MQLFAKFKKILRRGFRATLNFRKIKVALSPLRVFLAGHNFIVAMVTYCATQLTVTTSSPIIGQFVATMISASTGIEWLL